MSVRNQNEGDDEYNSLITWEAVAGQSWEVVGTMGTDRMWLFFSFHLFFITHRCFALLDHREFIIKYSIKMIKLSNSTDTTQ